MTFTVINDERPGKTGPIPLKRLLYKGEGIANFTPDSEYFDNIEGYLKVYGYMAEHRRRWNNGDRCNWSEDLRVTDLSIHA